MPTMSNQTILQHIIESRPHNRVGGVAQVYLGEEYINLGDADGELYLASFPVYDYHDAKGSNTRTGRTWRKKMRRNIKRQEQRAAAKDLLSQLDDLRLDQEEREENQYVLKVCPNVLATK